MEIDNTFKDQAKLLRSNCSFFKIKIGALLKISRDFSRSIAHFLIKIRQLFNFFDKLSEDQISKINLNQALDQKRSGPSRSRRLFIF